MSCEIIPNTPCPTQHDEYCLHPPNPQDEEQGIIEPKLVHEETDDPRNETPSANADSCLPHSNIQESPDESPDILNDAENNNDFCEEEDESALCVICLDTIDPSQRATGVCMHSFHYDCILEWTTNKHNDCPTCRRPLRLTRESAHHLRIELPDSRDVYAQTEEPDWPRTLSNRCLFAGCVVSAIVFMVYFFMS